MSSERLGRRRAFVHCKGCLLCAIAHLLGGLLILSVFALTAGPFLVATDTPAPADAIVVLAASVSRTRWQSEHGLRPSALDIEQQSE